MGVFRLNVDFDDTVEELALPEELTAADFSISVDDDCLTLNRPRRKSSSLRTNIGERLWARQWAR